MQMEQRDTVVTVKVRRLLPLGLLVSLEDGRTGVIRERELAWDRDARRHWREHFNPGDKLQVVVLGEREDGRLEFSLRLAQHDPWLDLPERYERGQLVEGVVTGVQPYGVFIEIEPGVAGLLHRQQLPAWCEEEPVDLFWPGDHVRVVVEAIDAKHRQIKLNLSKAWSLRWMREDELQTSQVVPAVSNRERHPRASNAPARLPLELALGQRRPYSVLVVEDDEVQCRVVADWFRRVGQHVITATNAEDALTLPKDERPDLVLMDLDLPGSNGIQAMHQIRAHHPQIRGAIMTDWARADEHLEELESLRAEGVSLLIKPLLPEDLVGLLSDVGEDEVSEPVADLLAEGVTLMAAKPRSRPARDDSLKEMLARLRRFTRAAKVVLFALDPAQRKVSVVAEHGHGILRENALVDLIHSPVRDVAEDRLVVRVQDIRLVEARVRYLIPLLPFRSCLGVPVPGDLPQRYALFFFHPRLNAFNEVHEEYARSGALALGALLERHQFQDWVAEIQRVVLLGHLTRALVHEMNHQLSPVGFALESLEEQCARIERLTVESPEWVEGQVHQARESLKELALSVRNLVATARLFGRLTIQGQEQILRLDEVVQEVVDLVRDTADRAHVTIEPQPPPRLLFTRVQAAQVQQILLNIVLNAVQQIGRLRSQGGGRVRIRIGQEHRDQDTVLQISVEDDGPGIHRRLWERIFELGFTSRRGEGSGLGLYITRSLVENLGGRVYVAESHILWGTIFVVELPFKI